MLQTRGSYCAGTYLQQQVGVNAVRASQPEVHLQTGATGSTGSYTSGTVVATTAVALAVGGASDCI